MLDRKYACEVLGLPEEATREEIEDRFALLVKKYRRLAPDEAPSAGGPPFSKINEAYRFLIGHEPLKPVRFRELSLTGKIRHVREHYMSEIAVGTVLVLLVCALAVQLYGIAEAVRAAP